MEEELRLKGFPLRTCRKVASNADPALALPSAVRKLASSHLRFAAGEEEGRKGRGRRVDFISILGLRIFMMIRRGSDILQRSAVL